jgi:hypothetical protein
MGTTSVTGVGQGSKESNEHMFLGVTHLIGPRWNEEKEKEFQEMKKLLKRLCIFNAIANVLITIFIFLSLVSMVWK